MYNKKTLTNIVKNLGSAKAPIKKRDIIYDPMGQWTNPGQDTRVPTPNGNITMGPNPETGQSIPFPVFAQPNVGPGVMMQPGQDYTFPGAKYVDEFPQVKKGGLVRQSKKYSKSLMAKNILFVKNALLKKKKSVKNKIFDPNSPYFKEGGAFEIELDENEIDQYRKGGYIVEDISIPSLTRMDDGAQVKGSQGLNSDFSTNLTAFINAAKADGIDLGIGSGFRSVEKQKQLWEQALKKYGSPEKARKWVAPPGKSNHNKGIAVDLSSSGVFLGKNKNTKATQWAHANAEKYGLHFRMGWEPWHIEPLNLSKEQKAKIDAEHQHSDNEDPNAHVDPNNAEALSKEGIDMTKYYQNLEKEQEITDIDNDYSNWNPQQEVVVDPKVEQLNAYSKLMSPSIQNVNDMYAATKMNQQQQQKQFAMGGYIDTELTDKEITNYKNGGYIVEYLD